MPNLTSVEKEFSDLTKRRGFLPSLIDKDISDSWKRCISTGLNPLKNPKRTILTSKELEELKEKGYKKIIDKVNRRKYSDTQLTSKF